MTNTVIEVEDRKILRIIDDAADAVAATLQRPCCVYVVQDHVDLERQTIGGKTVDEIEETSARSMRERKNPSIIGAIGA